VTPRALGRVLVTGSSGFLGSALVARLRAEGREVTASDLEADPSCDLTDFAMVEALVSRGFDTIFHCGAVSGPMVMADRPLDVWRINAGGAAHVLEAVRRHGSARVIVCSTTEVYGDWSGDVDEDTPSRPTSVYGASKLAAEAAVLGYLREGVDAVALRLSWIYGPGRRTPTMLESALRALAAGRDMAIGAHPDDPTHYLWIDDAVTGLMCAAAAPAPPHRIYNITAGSGLPMGEVVRLLSEAAPRGRVSLCDASPGKGPTSILSERARTDLGFSAGTSFATGCARYLAKLADQP